MNLPYWLLCLLPTWDYICPKCKEDVPKKSHTCPHCAENYGVPLRVPPKILKDQKALEAYVHKHVFPIISKAHRDYLTQFFTEIFNDGFESGDFSAWTGTTGSPAVVTSPVHHGTYSAELNGGEAVYKDFTSATLVYGRVYVRWTANPSSGSANLLFRLALSGTDKIQVGVYNDGGTIKWRLVARDSTNTMVTTTFATPNPTVDTWYCVEAKWQANTLNGAELWVDGSSIGTLNGTTHNSSVGRIRLRPDIDISYFDCVVVADAYIGPEGGATVQTVTDSLSTADAVFRSKTLTLPDPLGLSDAILRDKQFTLTDSIAQAELVDVIKGLVLKLVTDSVGLGDAVLRDKILGLLDSLGLEDTVSTPSRALQVLDSGGLADGALVSKVLQVTESISLVEVVDVGAGGVGKTKLFLVLGDLAVQLTGD